MLDVRKPIGYLFTIYGVILIGLGWFYPSGIIMEGVTWPINLNLIWGSVMGVFGIMMLLLELFERRSKQ